MKTEEKLPYYILSKSILVDGEFAWPYAIISAVVEAGRSVGAISVGGDLQFILPDGRRCESMNVGVRVYEHELADLRKLNAADLSAEIALNKFMNLGGVSAFIQEGMDGFSDVLRTFIIDNKSLESLIYFTWSFRGSE